MNDQSLPLAHLSHIKQMQTNNNFQERKRIEIHTFVFTRTIFMRGWT